MRKFLIKIFNLVCNKYEIYLEENKEVYNAYTIYCPKADPDSIFLQMLGEPENVIRYNHLTKDFYLGLTLGIKSALKLLKDNPELIKELQEQLN